MYVCMYVHEDEDVYKWGTFFVDELLSVLLALCEPLSDHIVNLCVRLVKLALTAHPRERKVLPQRHYLYAPTLHLSEDH